MKHHRTRSLTAPGLSACALAAALIALPALAQDIDPPRERTAASAAQPGNAQPSYAAYTPQSAEGSAPQAGNKRKPRWFDERRVQEDERVKAGNFERLSYTRYEGEPDAGSGSCVYDQSSYTYSCR